MSQRSTATRVPAIARPRVADPELQRFVDAVVENLEVRNGIRGDRADQGVTFRDLDAMNLQNSTEGMDPIPDPVGLKADAGPGFVTLEWLVPDYAGHALTEIWRADSEDFATASQVGSSRRSIFLDYIGFDVARYYWIRYVNAHDEKGRFSKDAVSATTVPRDGDPWDWEWIEEWLFNHPLFTAISSPIDTLPRAELPARILIRMRDMWQRAGVFFGDMDRNVDAQFNQLERYLFGEGSARVELEQELFARYGSRGGLIRNAFEAIAAEGEARAKMEQEILATLGEATAAIYNHVAEAVATETSARVVALESLYAQIDEEVSALISEEREVTSNAFEAVATTIQNNLAEYQDSLALVQGETAAVSTAQSATASKVDALETSTQAGLAQANTKIETVSAAQSIIATSVTNLEAQTATDRAALQSVSSVVSGPGGLAAQHYVKTDVNGRVSGYGLYNDGVSSLFAVNADSFAIGSGQTQESPFVVTGGKVYAKHLRAENLEGDVSVYAPVNWYGATPIGASLDHHIKSEALNKPDGIKRFVGCSLTINFISPAMGQEVRFRGYYSPGGSPSSKVFEHRVSTINGYNCVSINGQHHIQFFTDSSRVFTLWCALIDNAGSSHITIASITGYVHGLR